MTRWLCSVVAFALLYSASVITANDFSQDDPGISIGSQNMSTTERFLTIADLRNQFSSFTKDSTQQLKTQVTDLRYRALGRSKSCAFCRSKAKCGSLSQTSKRISHCQTVRWHYRKLAERNILIDGRRRYGYPDALLFYCWKAYCKKFNPAEYCGLHRRGKKPKMSDLDKMIKELKEDKKALTKRFDREAAPRFRYRDYRKRRDVIVKLQAQAKKNLNKALNARKRNYELKKQLQSPKYRKQIFDINQYNSETGFYKSKIKYWSDLEGSLQKALRTSSLQVKLFLTNIKKDVRGLHKEAELARRYKKSIKNYDASFKVLSEQQENLEDQIESINEEIKDIDIDYALFRKVSKGISGLLTTLTKKVAKGDIEIDCGKEALAVAIADFTT